ncbi:hypothetical protein DFH11DRAFT_798201 [Phellopilus nigrolimitatus]|nr:hypothetical protein DFH11DRAFT_798201 [Phellopilus nigrolimitatus]
MGVTMDEAYLLGGWFASALWGMYSVLFALSLYFIIVKRKSELYRPTTWIMVVMYSLATTHVFIALRRMIIALILRRNTPSGPIAYLADIGDSLNRAKDLIYITNLVLGDCVITWRCYVVWGNSMRVIALPTLMIIGTAIAGYGAIGQYFLSKPRLAVSVAWGTAMFAVSLATNIIVTLLTAGRIWYLTHPRRSVLGSADHRYRIIVLLVIESGAIVAAAKITEFVLFKTAPGTAAGDHPLYIVFDMMPQITGMMPTLIIAVVNAGLTSTNVYSGTVPSREPRGPERIVFHPRSTGFDATTGGVTDSSTDVEESRKSDGGIRLRLLEDNEGIGGRKRADASFGSSGSASGMLTKESSEDLRANAR